MEQSSKKRGLGVGLAILLLILGIIGYSLHIYNLKPDGQRTQIFARETFLSGAKASLRIQVDRADGTGPVEGSRAEISLLSQKGTAKILIAGKTNKKGLFENPFFFPSLPRGSYQLKIETSSPEGKDTQTLFIKVDEGYKILLNTDKPIYKPGQLIHIRTLTLQKLTYLPVSQRAITLEVFDPKGNKVYKKALKTSEYGIASGDFQLADEINEGEYRIQAIWGEAKAEKTVSVYSYGLPKFKVETTFSKGFYQPGETVKGRISAQYIFGKPVPGGKVKMEVSSLDMEFHEELTIQGETDQEGLYPFEFPLPKKLYGSEIAKDDGLLRVDIKVIDRAGHKQNIFRKITVSRDAIKIYGISENRFMVAGVPNPVYICTTYPDGRPAKTTLWIQKKKYTTSALGICKIEIKAKEGWEGFYVKARDNAENQATKALYFKETGGSDFYLTLNKVKYRVGDQMEGHITSSQKSRTYYLDILKDGQSLATRTIKGDKFSLPVKPGMVGTLVVQAYCRGKELSVRKAASVFDSTFESRRFVREIERDREPVFEPVRFLRDQKVTLVVPARDLSLQIKRDKKVYRPGEKATLEFSAQNSKGQLVDTALSLAVVDEAVFALQDLKPGLEKVYFMLQKELLIPRIPTPYSPPLSPEQLLEGSERESLQKNREEAARVLVALSSLAVENLRWTDTYQEKMKVVRSRQKAYLNKLKAFLLPLPPLLIFFFLGLAIFSYRKKKQKGLSFSYTSLIRTLPRKDDRLVPLKEARQLMENFYLALWTFLLFLIGMVCITPLIHSAPSTDGYLGGLFSFFTGGLLFTFLYSLVYTDTLEISGQRVRWTGLAASLVLFAFAMKVPDQPWKVELHYGTILCLFLGLAGALTVFRQLFYGIKFFRQPEKLEGASWALVLVLLFPLLILFWAFSLYYGAEGISYAFRHQHPLLVNLYIASGIGLFVIFSLVYSLLASYIREKETIFSPSGALIMVVFILFVISLVLPSVSSSRKISGRAKIAQTSSGAYGIDDDNDKKEGSRSTEPQTAPPQAPRIRRHFPETLYWNPEFILKKGKGILTMPVSDSITTFRISGQGVTKKGELGSFAEPLRVFQDFFIDLDLPIKLTVGDELSLPVAVYNYLPHPQTVKVEIEKREWFELLDKSQKSLTIREKEVGSVHFKIRAQKFGHHKFLVKAIGTALSDGIEKGVEVLPHGKRVDQSRNGYLSKSLDQEVVIPKDSIPGTHRIFVKVYPGLGATLIEGVAGLLELTVKEN